MNPLLFLVFILLTIILYCIFANVLRLPSFKANRAFKKKNAHKQHTFSTMLDVFSKSATKHIPMSILKQAELKKVLQAANIEVTPKEYLAAAIVHSLLFLLFAIPLFFINHLIALIPAAFTCYIFYSRYHSAFKAGDKRKIDIEKELPRFVAYMAHTLKSSHNLINMIDTYKANYHSALTDELAFTVADMRTGNQERALQHLEARINSPLMGELVRGLLSASRGEDMTAYFDNLSYKLTEVGQQRLKEQALKKEPKIARMSYLLFGVAMVSIFVILIISVQSAFSMMGG